MSKRTVVIYELNASLIGDIRILVLSYKIICQTLSFLFYNSLLITYSPLYETKCEMDPFFPTSILLTLVLIPTTRLIISNIDTSSIYLPTSGKNCKVIFCDENHRHMEPEDISLKETSVAAAWCCFSFSKIYQTQCISFCCCMNTGSWRIFI